MITNQKIFRAIQKGLNEALTNLSVDDFDDIEIDNTNHDKEDISTMSGVDAHWEWEAKKFLSNANNVVHYVHLSPQQKRIIRYINSHPDKCNNIVKADNATIHHLVRIGIEVFGNKGCLNWIDTSEVTKLHGLFVQYKDFNGDISRWNMSNVEEMTMLFNGSKFNGDISNWNVSNVKDMYGLFAHSNFNKDISKWDVSNVTNMQYMFAYSKFNKDLSGWDVRNVVNMAQMFEGSVFNKDISKWNVSNVKRMDRMFMLDKVFNKDLSKWNVRSLQDKQDIYKQCPIDEKYKFLWRL